MTGVPAGERAADGSYPIGSVFRAVAIQLAGFASKARLFNGIDGAKPRRRRRRGDEA
ncbi:hypothetical protein D3C83_139030 [compost metagenome]